MDSAHPLSALASNLVGVGKAFVSMSIQFGIVWLLSKGIAALVNNIDSSINAMKYAKEAAENLNKAYEDMNTTQKQNTKTVEEYGKTWEKLKDGVDENTGKNISLSDDEYNQYDGLKTKWDKATEAQTAAQEAMTATDSNGGVLTKENYDKLIGANKAYGAAVTTIGGVTTIDSDRLNSSNL